MAKSPDVRSIEICNEVLSKSKKHLTSTKVDSSKLCCQIEKESKMFNQTYEVSYVYCFISF